ncbi:MAG TPA: T9SS type A sorting domain-containing protein [Bacteroidia bacterium]|nr:T9SS type A sorting domain-containing protein [Bacteroidia bacterium]
MKKQLLLLISLSILCTTQIYAQCIPNTSITVPGIYPDSATNLPHGVVNMPYVADIQAKIPPDTTIAICGYTIVNYFAITGVSGLPAGFTWDSNPVNDTFPGGSNGCVRIQGTAPATTGIYNLTVQLQANGTSAICGPIGLPYSITYYKIVIDSSTGIAPVPVILFDVMQNSPNPLFDASTEITFTVPASGKVDFRVIDLLGKELVNRKIDAVAGLNRSYLSSKYLKPGIYFYSVTYRSKTITRKMIVAARP